MEDYWKGAEKEDYLETLDVLAAKLRSSGFFLDVAALPGAERIVGIALDGATHTWTLDQAEALVKQLKQIKKVI
jgi:hypothetical protein